jgi:hypothetical protein
MVKGGEGTGEREGEGGGESSNFLARNSLESH